MCGAVFSAVEKSRFALPYVVCSCSAVTHNSASGQIVLSLTTVKDMWMCARCTNRASYASGMSRVHDGGCVLSGDKLFDWCLCSLRAHQPI